MLFRRSVRGESLIELIVALVVLEIIGSAALAAALTIERINRHAALGAADDMTRWLAYRTAESSAGCVTASAPDSVTLLFAATPDRAQFATVLRCGR